jgi:hypothetical protein
MKQPISYLDFDLRIERDGDGYRAEVMNSPAGQAACVFKAPFSGIELENFLLRVGRPRHSTRRMDSPEIAAAKSYGGKLYDAVMSGEVQARWLSSLTEAETQGHGLRLRLRIADAPELNGMPWEYLYNASLNRFLSLSERTPLVRYLELPERIKPLAVEAPIRVLVAISSPSNHPKLDVEREWTQLQEALQPLIGAGLVVMDRVTNPRLSALRDKLRAGEYHMLHFIGHGGFDTGSDEGALVFCDQEGKGRIVGAQRFGTILHDHQSLRLVILNACEGSRTSEKDPFAGTAQTLVQQGVPAVIAMQFEITDPAAITFAKEFYTVVAGGHPVDAALAQARLAIFADENDIEWGTPVLYMRAQDGRIFTVRHDPNKPVIAQPIPTPQPAPVQPTPIQAPMAPSPTITAPQTQTPPQAPPAAPPPKPATLTGALGIEPLDVAAGKVFAPFLKTPGAARSASGQTAAGQPDLKWYQRRPGQIGLSILGVVVGIGGMMEGMYVGDGAVVVITLLLAVNVLAVAQRWTWLLYSWGVVNVLLALLMLVAMGTSYSERDQQLAAGYLGAFLIELFAIYQTIRSIRWERQA